MVYLETCFILVAGEMCLGIDEEADEDDDEEELDWTPLFWRFNAGETSDELDDDDDDDDGGPGAGLIARVPDEEDDDVINVFEFVPWFKQKCS